MDAPVRPRAGDMGDPAFWKAEVYDKFLELYAGWTSYSPTWTTSNATQPSLGNGSLTGRYKALGKTVWFSLRFQAGSSTTFGDGLWTFSLPSGRAPTAVQSCGGVLIGPSSNRYPAACWLSTGTGVFRIIPYGGTGGVRTNSPNSGSVPFAWASGHQIILGGVYESN